MTRSTLALFALTGIAGAALIAAVTTRTPRTETTDFGVTRTAVTPAFDARVQPASNATVREFRIPITHDTIEISEGVKYEGWTFGGTVPGPVIRVRQGDQVKVVLVNRSEMGHSIDFHSAR